ncbi:MAG: cation transporter [Dinoroseobacter sp.]|nr:cation transporter [Dinoroseobacter sp.]
MENDTNKVEERSLKVSMIGNLWMAAVGIWAAVLSGSQAILVDGLFSLIGFAAAGFALKVTRDIARRPDRIRPFGYGTEESIFTTFRALTLLGLVLFGIGDALWNIATYIGGSTPEPLNYGPVATYLVIVCVTCGVLWAFHRHAWRKSGKSSDILKLEANAVAFDAGMTVAAGAGLFLIRYLGDGWLAPIAPVGDSLIVLGLCSMAAAWYFADFKSGLAELGGTAASKSRYKTVRKAIRGPLDAWGGTLVDLAVVKAGRSFSVLVFVDPRRPVTAIEVEALGDHLNQQLQQVLGHVDALVTLASDVEQSGRAEVCEETRDAQ